MIGMAVAFMRRDLLIAASYRFAFVLQLIFLVTLVALLYVAGGVVGDELANPAKEVSGSYFEFLLAGVAFTDVFTFGLGSFPRAIRDGQASGTLESVLLTPSRLFPIVMYSSTFGFLQSVLRLTVITIIAVAGFGFWRQADALSVAVLFGLGVAVFGCLGVLSASFTLVFKQGDPVVGIYGLISIVLGGLLFPVSVLPEWIQPLAAFVPLSHALGGMRLALAGASLADIASQIAALALMLAIFLPLSVVTFRWAIGRAKQEGSLVQY